MLRHAITGFTLAATLLAATPPALAQFAAPLPPTTPIGSAGYLLGVGDRIEVEVFNAPEYSGEYRVLAGGIVNLPFVGDVNVERLTLQQATGRISEEMAVYIRRPRVVVRLLDARPLQVAIAGEVNRPGSYRVSVGQGEAEVPTLTEVIELAGGITQFADLRNIKVQRVTSKAEGAGQAPLFNADEAQSTSVIEVNLWQLLKDGSLEEDLLLQDGDRIEIATATALTPEEVTELASASFAADEMVVNVVGEVASPGAIALPPNTPLNQAVLAAGGFTNRARTKRVTLVRLNPNGTVARQTISVDPTAGLNDENNPALRPNDTVVVSRSTLSRVGDTVGSVISPLGGIFGILRTIEALLD
ncbi:MAG: SLBB domain-containing protein [Cyanobacteria bacterium P01_A01_bin.135]